MTLVDHFPTVFERFPRFAFDVARRRPTGIRKRLDFRFSQNGNAITAASVSGVTSQTGQSRLGHFNVLWHTPTLREDLAVLNELWRHVSDRPTILGGELRCVGVR